MTKHDCDECEEKEALGIETPKHEKEERHTIEFVALYAGAILVLVGAIAFIWYLKPS